MQLPECHFKWKPENGATRKFQGVKGNAVEKMKLGVDALNNVGYYTLLAYLYSQPDMEEFNYREAEKYLKMADEVSQKVQSGQLSSDYVTCQFVIDANRLCIQRERRQNSSELPSRIQELQTRWEHLDPESRAAVFAVKGLALMRFGLTKYPEAVEAYAEANRLSERSKYLYLFGEANLMGRIRRSESVFTPASEHEVNLWQDAYHLSTGASADFYRPNLVVLYAESMLNNMQLDLCKSLTDEAWNSLRGSNPKELVKHHRVMMTCAKCYRIIKAKHCRDNQALDTSKLHEIDENQAKILDCLLTIKDEIPRPRVTNLLFVIAIDFKNSGRLIECRNWLETAHKIAERPGHIYVDCMLIDMRRMTKDELNETYTVEDCIADYDHLIARYSTFNKNVATLLLNKAEFLMQEKMITEAFDAMLEADELDPTCWNRLLAPEKISSMHNVITATARKDHLAWFLHRINDQIPRWRNDPNFCLQLQISGAQIEGLYQTALDVSKNNQFALEHLGRFYLKQQKLNEAADCFEKLAFDHVSRQRLLAVCDFEKLVLRLGCGCKDAAIKIIRTLQDRKSNDKTAQRVMKEALDPHDAPKHPVFFDRSVYELCAKIDIMLHDTQGFFIEPGQCQKSDDFVKDVMAKIDDLLELNSLTSSETSQQHCGSANDRGSLMRSNRLRATKLCLLGSDSNQKDLNNLVVLVLKESKEVLDRSMTSRMHGPNTGREFSYVHAFNQMKNDLGGDFKKQFNNLTSESERKKFEMESLARLLKEQRNRVSLENVRASLLKALNNKNMKNFHQNAGTTFWSCWFNFMANREHRILSREHCWIIRWIYPVNNEKHGTEMSVNELDDQLRSDWSRVGDCLTAYDMAHLAAEFAEETWAVFSDGIRETSTGESSHDVDVETREA